MENLNLLIENLDLLEPILYYVGAIALLTNLLVQLFRMTVPKFPSHLLPLAATVIGALIGMLHLIVPELSGDLSVGGHILAGAVSGLFATKTYDAIIKPTAYALSNKTDNNHTNNKF